MPSSTYNWSNLYRSIDNIHNDQRREEYDRQRMAVEAARREYVYNGSRYEHGRQRVAPVGVIQGSPNEVISDTTEWGNYYTSQIVVTDENILLIRRNHSVLPVRRGYSYERRDGDKIFKTARVAEDSRTSGLFDYIDMWL